MFVVSVIRSLSCLMIGVEPAAGAKCRVWLVVLLYTFVGHETDIVA